jgi:hypothetical protein
VIFGASNRRPYEMVLDGKIIKGVGSASTVLPQLLPILAREYDELRNAHPATINVDVDNPIDLKIDFKTDQILCAPPCLHRVEFVRVRFEFPLGTVTNEEAWIYQPYGWHWGCGHKSWVEVLVSKELANVEPDRCCKIHVLNGGFGSSSTSEHYLAA